MAGDGACQLACRGARRDVRSHALHTHLAALSVVQLFVLITKRAGAQAPSFRQGGNQLEPHGFLDAAGGDKGVIDWTGLLRGVRRTNGTSPLLGVEFDEVRCVALRQHGLDGDLVRHVRVPEKRHVVGWHWLIQHHIAEEGVRVEQRQERVRIPAVIPERGAEAEGCVIFDLNADC